ncbi:MAG TPA: response regulator [Salinivirgaceae bacterium]|nr:response regulator [Salinivirgaceae bacterium]
MKFLIFTISVTNLLLFTFSNSAFSQNCLTLKVGITPDAPPYEYVINGKAVGYNIDVLEAIKQRIPIEFIYIQKNYATLKRDLERGQIDLMTTIFHESGNLRKFRLLSPHNKIRLSIFGHSNQSDPAQNTGTYYITDIPEVYEIFSRNKNMTCYLVSSMQCESFFSQNKDNIYLIYPEKAGLFFSEKYNYNDIWSKPIDSVQLFYSMGFNYSNDSLAKIFNEALSMLIKSGELQKIQEKWFINPNKESAESLMSPTFPYQSIYYVIITILALGLILIIWRFRKQISNLQNKIKILEGEISEVNVQKTQLQNIIDAIPHPMFVVNEKNQPILWNKNLNRLLGLDENNESSLAILESTKNDAQYLKLFSGEFNPNEPLKIVDHSGLLKILQISRHPIDENHILIFAQDISKRYKAEKRLEQESGLLFSIINSIPDLIFYKDTLFRYIGSNSAFKRYNNFTDDDYIGKTDYELFDVKQALEYHEVDRKVLETSKSQRVEKWGILPNGKSVLFDTLKVPFYGQDGRILGIVGISRDITQQYEIQKALSESKLKAEESDRLKTIFLASISHEIRTPLNSIIGFSDLLQDEDLTDDQREDFLEMIRKSSNSLLQLVDDIIDLSKIESNQIRIKPEPTSLKKLLSDVAGYFDKQLQGNEYKDINFEIVDNESDFKVTLDAFQIKQILIHIINNAFKYTRKGTFRIGYYHKENFVEFYIEDKNASVSDYVLSNLLERNAFSGGMENYGGVGLNLIIARGLVRLMGGEISVTRCQDQKGIVFSFFIPLAINKSEENKQSDDKIFEGKTLLVAEDEKNNFIFIEESLRKTGIKILWALNGKEALEMVADNKNIDAVLMDIKMPLMDGYTATREIKNLRPNLPIIAQTAYALADEKQKSLEAGCNAYLSKPIRPSHLIDTLATFIKK